MIDALISVMLTVPESHVEAGSLPVIITIKNVSKSDVVVAKRFAVMPRSGDLEFVISHDGKKLPYRLRVRLPPMKAGHFVVLKPDETLTHKFSLQKEYDFTKPGTYEMQVIYRIPEFPEGFVLPKAKPAKSDVISPKIIFKHK
jgi:hypothetical protein